MKNRLSSLIIAAMIIFTPWMGSQGTALASAPVPGFIAYPILPESNLNASPYFNMNLPHTHTHTLEVHVKNTSPDPVTLDVQVTSAYGSESGMIVYENRDTSLPRREPSLPELLSFMPEGLPQGADESVLSVTDSLVTLAPYSGISLPFLLQTTDRQPFGQVLGGIVITRMDTPERQPEDRLVITSLYSYTIAVLLHGTAEATGTPSFTLQAVSIGKTAGYPAIAASILNNVPQVITGATMDVQLYREGALKPAIERTDIPFALPPGAAMPYTLLFTQEDSLPSGDYELLILIHHMEKTHSFRSALYIP